LGLGVGVGPNPNPNPNPNPTVDFVIKSISKNLFYKNKIKIIFA